MNHCASAALLPMLSQLLAAKEKLDALEQRLKNQASKRSSGRK
jgi:hypothetical protein